MYAAFMVMLVACTDVMMGATVSDWFGVDVGVGVGAGMGGGGVVFC